MSIVIKSALYGVLLTLALVVGALMLVLKMGWYVWIPGREMAAMAASTMASKALLNQIEDRNKAKFSKLKSQVAKKASKRMATSTVAGMLPGSAVIAGVATAGFLIEDHCEELQDAFELDQLLKGGSEKFDHGACLKEMQAEAVQWGDDARQEALMKFTVIRDSLKYSLQHRK